MNRILVIQLRQLGDILLTTPCLKALKTAFPTAKVTFLSHAMGRLVMDQSPHVDEHLTYDGQDSVWDHFALVQSLRRQRFDLALDFMGNPRSALYTWASGAKKKVGFESARRLAYQIQVPRPSSEEYIVDGKFSLLRAIGVRAEDRRLVLPWFEEHTRPTIEFLESHRDFRESSMRVVLSPTHRREARRWPLARYAQLSDLLVQTWGATVIWLWGPGEEAEIDAARALTKEASLKAPRTSFREMAAFLANTDLFIGNSNGPSHVAVAVDTPSVQLHGPTSGRSWCPETERHRYLQGATMQDIAVDHVGSLLSAMQDLIVEHATHRTAQKLRCHWEGS